MDRITEFTTILVRIDFVTEESHNFSVQRIGVLVLNDLLECTNVRNTFGSIKRPC